MFPNVHKTYPINFLGKFRVIENQIRITDIVDHRIQLVPGGLLGGLRQPVHLFDNIFELFLDLTGQIYHLNNMSVNVNAFISVFAICV